MYGKVTDGETDEPLAGVTVVVQNDVNAPSYHEQDITDEDGCYAMHLMRSGKFVLIAYYLDLANQHTVAPLDGHATLFDVKLHLSDGSTP